MIFPYGDKPSMVLPSERFAQRHSVLAREAPPANTPSDEAGILTCFDAAGVGREQCSRDKDGRCVFCDRRRISKWRS